MIKAVQATISLCFVLCVAAITQHATTVEQLARSAQQAKSNLLSMVKDDRQTLMKHALNSPQQFSSDAVLQSSSDYAYYVMYNFTSSTCSEGTAYVATAYHLNTCLNSGNGSSIMYACNGQGFGALVYSESGCKGSSVFVVQVKAAKMNTCLEEDIQWGEVDDYDDDYNEFDITKRSWSACSNQLDFGFSNAATFGFYLDTDCGTLYQSNHVVVDTCFSTSSYSEYCTCGVSGLNSVHYSEPNCMLNGDPSKEFSRATNVCQDSDAFVDDDDDGSDRLSPYKSFYVACDALSLPGWSSAATASPTMSPTGSPSNDDGGEGDDDGAVMPFRLPTLLVSVPVVLFAATIIQYN